MDWARFKHEWEPQSRGVFSGIEVQTDPLLPKDCIVFVFGGERRVFRFLPNARDPERLVEVTP